MISLQVRISGNDTPVSAEAFFLVVVFFMKKLFNPSTTINNNCTHIKYDWDFITLSTQDENEFIDFITSQAKNIAINIDFPSTAINVIRNYIKKFPKSAALELPKLTEAILQ